MVLVLVVDAERIFERVTGRRIDRMTGRTYHVKFNPPPDAIASRLVVRADDTIGKVRSRLTFYQNYLRDILEAFSSCKGPPIIEVSFCQMGMQLSSLSLSLSPPHFSLRVIRFFCLPQSSLFQVNANGTPDQVWSNVKGAIESFQSSRSNTKSKL